jgi:hypothetical protein
MIDRRKNKKQNVKSKIWIPAFAGMTRDRMGKRVAHPTS